MLKINSQKIALILIALITVGCSDPKDKYIALECKENGSTFINLILNKETMTWDAYLIYGDDFASGTYQEAGEHYYHLNGEDINDIYLDRRTLLYGSVSRSSYDCLQDKNCSSSEGLEFNNSEPCKIIDLPEEYLNNKSDLKTDQQNQI